MVEPMTMVGLWRIQSSRGLRGTEVVSVVAVIASVPDTRIEEGVADVDQQVHQHLGPRKQDDQPLDDREVALQDRVHRQQSEAGNVEERTETGRAPWREEVGPYVWILVVGV